MSLRTGFSLVELALVLSLIGIACTIAVPPLARGLDAYAVRAAADALAAAVSRAQAAAAARGGASLVVDVERARCWVEDAGGDRVGGVLELGGGFRVGLESHGAGGAVLQAIRFDALGIGQLAARTFRLRRGDAEAVLVVSGYGRVRRL